MFTLRTLKAGDKVRAGYRDHRWNCEFLGFTDNSTAHSETPVYKSFKEMPFVSFADMDMVDDRNPYGFTHRALFRDLTDYDTGQTPEERVWTAYRYRGRWVVGTSADILRLEA